MKVKVRNLGAINEAELDLKPLTVFIGPNNTGKTWMAYALTGIFGPFGWNHYLKDFDKNEFAEKYPTLHTTIEQALEEGNAKFDIVQFGADFGEIYFNDVARHSKKWMGEFMGTKYTKFEDLELVFNLTDTKHRFLEEIKNYSIDNKISPDKRRKSPLLHVYKEAKEPFLYFYTVSDISEKLPSKAINEFLMAIAFQILHKALYKYVYPFPTERTTFITYKLIAEKRRKKSLSSGITSENEENALPTIIGLFLDMLWGTYSTTIEEREKEIENNHLIQKYLDLAKTLETDILKGKVDFSTQELNPTRELLFQATENSKLELHIVSSMIKELSSLVLCLRYQAEPGELLIIDEPEMNLHPKAQVALIEFLAMLVEAGLNVLITTHSPYMVDHLVNLMKAAKHKDKESIREKFRLQRTEAFIPQEKVSVSLFKDGTAKNVLCEDGTIDWDTFGQVSDYVSQLYFDLDS